MEDKELLLSIMPGDMVMHTGSEEWELVDTIEHKNHGVRGNDEGSCCINGYFWYYDNIKKVMFSLK